MASPSRWPTLLVSLFFFFLVFDRLVRRSTWAIRNCQPWVRRNYLWRINGVVLHPSASNKEYEITYFWGPLLYAEMAGAWPTTCCCCRSSHGPLSLPRLPALPSLSLFHTISLVYKVQTCFIQHLCKSFIVGSVVKAGVWGARRGSSSSSSVFSWSSLSERLTHM